MLAVASLLAVLAELTAPPTLRLCLVVLPMYEQHTLVHHITYHRLIGVDEFFVYVDDRPDRNKNRTLLSTLTTSIEHLPGVHIFYFTQTANDQLSALAECTKHGRKDRARAGYPPHLWIANLDADEYIAPANPVLTAMPSSPAVLFNLKAWLSQFPANAALVPRRNLINSGDLTGKILLKPPVDVLGPRFFEPRAYTRLSPQARACRVSATNRSSPGTMATVYSTAPRPKWIVRASSLDRMQYTPASIHGLPRDIFKFRDSTLLFSNGQRFPCNETTKDDWMHGYDGPIIFHVTKRSVAECMMKAMNQGKGVAATVDLNAGTQHAAHRGRKAIKCAGEDRWVEEERIFNLLQHAGAVEAEVGKV